jgi:predicted alpha/beta superfamily hydrolase
MKLAVLLATIVLTSRLAGQTKPCTSTVVGDLRVQSFQSKIFGDTQTLRIWLPPGYNQATNAHRIYPVLYMLDGQNLFDACTSGFGHEWQIDEALTRLISTKEVEPIIVVGIDNPGIRRADEYIPFADASVAEGPQAPHGDRFPEFLTSEVLPHVAASFRVSSLREERGIGGSSYGAVAALYSLLKRPGDFGLGLLESTSLQVGNGELLRMTSPLIQGPNRVFIGVGGSEANGAEALVRRWGSDAATANAGFAHASQLLAANLKAAEFNHPQVLFRLDPAAKHEETAWAKRFPEAIRFLFPATATP